jgi:hypothetical protein
MVYDFKSHNNVSDWYQTNDDVMGGISKSYMSLDKNGNGVFSGNVSTKYNGGFAMTRLPVNIPLDKKYSKVILRLKGDGKKYQFRLKANRNQRFWYVQEFQTTKEMSEIVLPLKDFYAAFRGYKLDIDNFSENSIQEIAILIGNKKNENFKIEIETIKIN